MLSRRNFLNHVSVAGAGCLSIGSLAPAWWARMAIAAEQANTARRLIVIELRGGNDGLNTVIPFGDDAYHRARPTLAIAADKVIKLDGNLGLHPEMKSWRALWDAGKLAIVENCGYPQPNRSHFESMAIWHWGAAEPTTSGWLGRAADQAADLELCYVGDGAIPQAVSRRERTVAALARLSDLRLRKDAVQDLAAPEAAADDLTDYFHAQLREAQSLSEKLPDGLMSSLAGLVNSANGGRQAGLTERLSLIRQLMERDQPFRVYYTALDGFDTHADQAGTHAQLWKTASDSVSGFLSELQKKKLADGVSVFLFSEFGRRVKENGSQGTDHGAAAPVFLLGDRVRGGLQGGLPNLSDLDDGDLKFQVDFRDVYAGVLQGALGLDPTPTLGPRAPLAFYS